MASHVNKISFVDDNEPILFNTNKGGMKALAKKRVEKKVEIGFL